MSGDALTVELFLDGAVIAFVIATLSAQPGWRRPLFGVATSVTTGAALWWWHRPDMTPWISALFHSGALILVLTVGTVALIVPRGPYSPLRRPNPLAEVGSYLSGWKPDICLEDAFMYLGTESTWVTRFVTGYTVSVQQVKRELLDKLRSGQVVAWGRNHPGAKEVQISRDFWKYVNVDLRTEENYAFQPAGGIAAYNIRMARDEVTAAWPPSAASTS